MCCTMTIPGASGGSASSSTRSASVPPVEAPISTTFSVVRTMASLARARAMTASAVSLGSTVRRREQAPHTRARRGLHRGIRMHRATPAGTRPVPSLGLVITSTAPYSSALSVRFRALLRQAGAHDHRNRPLAHELAQEGQTVHARHFDIENDDVGHLLAHPFGGDKGVAMPSPSPRSQRSDCSTAARVLPHHRGIVDDQYPYRHGQSRASIGMRFTKTSPVAV